MGECASARAARQPWRRTARTQIHPTTPSTKIQRRELIASARTIAQEGRMSQTPIDPRQWLLPIGACIAERGEKC